MAIMSGVITILGTVFICETYTPVILRQRAERLSRITNKVYISALDAGQPPTTTGQKLKVALIRPWIFLFREPIVLITSIYVVIIYGTMYLNFAAYPIVFQRARGWGVGLGGLAFTGTAVGVILATVACYVDYKYYVKAQETKKTSILPPEYRLRSTIVGSFLVPIGLFWFAWTCQPSIHWIVPILGSVVFACGLVMVFMSLLNYLIDSCKLPTPRLINNHLMLSRCRLRSFRHGCQLSLAIRLRCRFPTLYHRHVRESWTPMGQFCSRIPRIGVYTVSTHLL